MRRTARFGKLFRLYMPFVLGLFVIGGCAPSFLVTPVNNADSLDEKVVASGRGFFPDKIAIVEVEGLLANVKSGGLLSPTENPVSLFKQELDKAADDDAVKAVVLRVNSPGGTVSGSDTMYELLQRFKAKTHKPVVASIQEVGASGAYYTSCAADRIIAGPTSLVGSIGVIFETFNLQGTLGKIGVEAETYKSAVHKDLGSPFRQPTADEKAIFQGLVDEYYARFKRIVADNRHLSPEAASWAVTTDGRVFSGEQALARGLVDQVGILGDAINTARKLAKVPGAEVVAYKRPYGYSGSIYALDDTTPPRANVTRLELPEAATPLPAGFYYIWRP